MVASPPGAGTPGGGAAGGGCLAGLRCFFMSRLLPDPSDDPLLGAREDPPVARVHFILPPARVVRAPSACLQGVWRRERSAVAPPHDVEFAESLDPVSGCFLQSKGRRATRNKRRTKQINRILSPGPPSCLILQIHTRFTPNSSVHVLLTPMRVF